MIEIWPFYLSDLCDDLLPLLPAEEQGRAATFLRAAPRQRFVQSRAVLRTLAARRLGVSPVGLPIRRTPTGKPYIPDAGLHVNLSHSEGIAVCAFCESSPVGIDIEQIRLLPEMLSIAHSHFSSEEYRRLQAMDPAAQCEAFFQGWTRREAYVKALGDGLSRTLSAIRFGEPSHPGGPMPVLAPGSPWLVHDLRPAEGYLGAVCYQGDEHAVHVHSCVAAEELIETMEAAPCR